MTLLPREPARCQLCGAEIPVMPVREFVDQGYRGLMWDERGPYYFCPAHSWADADLWIAETLVCDRGHVRYLRELYGRERP